MFRTLLKFFLVQQLCSTSPELVICKALSDFQAPATVDVSGSQPFRGCTRLKLTSLILNLNTVFNKKI